MLISKTFYAMVSTRKQNLDRQIKATKKTGKHLSKPKSVTLKNWDEVYNEWKAKKITAMHAMRLLGVGKNIFYK